MGAPFKFKGLLSARPVDPKAGQEYTALDTTQKFTCFVDSIWSEDTAAALAKTTVAIRNETGSTILKGKLLYAAGFNVSENRILVDLADKDDSAKRPAICIAQGDILDDQNSEGLVVGELIDIDTASFSLTDQLVLGNSGAFIRPPPDTSPFTGEIQLVGSVTRVHATNGRIMFDCGQGLEPVTATQVFALQGTDGIPSDTNRYVTDSDPRLLASGSSAILQNVFNEITTDSTFASATFVDLLTQSITISSGSNVLVFASISAYTADSNRFVNVRLLIDGIVQRGFGFNSATQALESNSGMLVYKATGLAAGARTFKLQILSDGGSTITINGATDKDKTHCSLLLQEVTN